ncbi:antigen WC1.1-like isoform X3 [Falco peregrinus]|uniref:antigen WC1.1-like isoform X3 n=1 Tax=Falco peregrinus TaxID=8954 RepID=UPI0024796732|nr:antigen WC1.1-like isoform X3 [Falco peregrinus]
MGKEGLLFFQVLWLLPWVQLCRGAAEVRLENGGRRCAGRVEVKQQGQWGTVCGVFWDMKDATVVCNQLGCGSAVGAPKYEYFGPGSGPVWMFGVHCRGTERALSDCTNRREYQEDCNHSLDAGVICSGFVQLTGGDSPCSGRVEIHSRGSWRAVCDSDFGPKAADVVCRELQCGAALSVVGAAPFGEHAGPMWNGLLQCMGNESLLVSCPRGPPRDQPCTHGNAAGIICTRKDSCWGVKQEGDAGDRGVGQGGCCARREDGRRDVVACSPKVMQKEEKGRVSSAWPLLQLLREREHRSALPRPSLFPEYTGFRLNNGTACEGRVEVQVQGTWGSLCASRWDLLDAHVLCRHLNCGFAETIPERGRFGRGTGPIWRDSFHCNGTEEHLGQCSMTTLGASPCSREDEAAVICSGPADSKSLRLVGGESRCNGRVEIFHHGTWGRVLDDNWDMQEANVVCQQLRCGAATAAYKPLKAQRGRGPVGLRGVRCAGQETSLTACRTSLPKNARVAEMMEDVGVVCSGSWQIRLVDGPGRCAGRVEVYNQGSWGTVCDDGWDLLDATVVCRQLDCGGAVDAVRFAQFGAGSGEIWLDNVNCSGNESALWDCPAVSWEQQDCGHKEDAGVICSDFMALRLENSNNCSGRLQVFYNGTWGGVCSNSVTPKTVSLACKELGCGNRGSLEMRLPYGRVSGPTWLDHVQCEERISSFWQCPSSPWNPQSCRDLRDETYITCNGSWTEAPPTLEPPCPNSTSCTDREKIRAMGGEDKCSGRVEIWHRGSWGTVCDDSWDMQDAEVACRQLGCGPAVSALDEAAFGQGMGPIWLEKVECRGTELSLQDCWAQPGDSGACRHKEDASVRCSAPLRTAAPASQTDPTPEHLTGSRSISLPVVICIILGGLLCLLLALLVGQIQSARAWRKALPLSVGSGTSWEPFPAAVYEEINYRLAWEKEAKFRGSGSYSEGFPIKLQPYPQDSKEEDGLGPAPDVLDPPGGYQADGYDDVREASGPGEDPVSRQGDWEMPVAPEEGAGPMDAPGGANLPSQRSAGAPGAVEGAWSLSLESAGYDDAEEVSLAHPPEDTEAVAPGRDARLLLLPRSFTDPKRSCHSPRAVRRHSIPRTPPPPVLQPHPTTLLQHPLESRRC